MEDFDNIEKVDDSENEENEFDSTDESYNQLPDSNDESSGVTFLSGMYQNWFLDYASYVILERAVPYVNDGLKPVQRRILHSMWEMEDGRYNKVANIIGNTMKYHPHGDASIGDALVQLGQKDLLIDCQGNWGNIFTGDHAAAPRYIEARLSKLALDILFNPKTTQWKSSYDGRNKEPLTLPVKFPLLLAQGVEGIAVGLASKILPHNFNELIDASIDVLKGKDVCLYPDFPTGGFVDVSRYNAGLRGGKIRVRAKISQVEKKALVITEIPFGTTTTSLIESILAANDKGKIKIRKIDDNTSDKVEIMIYLQPGISPDITIDALYAFTDCEVSISPNSCIIEDNRPKFLDVNTLLKISVKNTVDLLKLELEIEMHELLEKLHFASLEKIFIEERIYHDIEDAESLEIAKQIILKGLDPFKHLFIREITDDDINRLLDIRMRRITKFDAFKAEEAMIQLKDSIAEIQNHLDNLVEFAINYYKQIKKKYGKDKDRKSEIRAFDVIQATEVAVANLKLYINREEGFAGSGLTKHEYVCDCSDIDDIIYFREDGKYFISKVQDKFFVGKNCIHIAVFKKNDENTTYNVAYRHGNQGVVYAKRFNVTGVTRDKEYDVTQGEPGSKIIWFSVNPNGEAEVIKIFLKPRPKLKKLIFDFNFADISIKGRSSQGNILSRNPIHKIIIKEVGVSVMNSKKIWYDEATKRLNVDGNGLLVGDFLGRDKIITFMKSGHYRMYHYDLSTHFDDDMIVIEKYKPGKAYTAIYYDNNARQHFIKRFEVDNTEKKTMFLGDEAGLELVLLLTDKYPRVELVFKKDGEKAHRNEEINVSEFALVKGIKAKGKRLSNLKVAKINVLEPLEIEEPEPEVPLEIENPEVLSQDKKDDDDTEPKQITLEF